MHDSLKKVIFITTSTAVNMPHVSQPPLIHRSTRLGVFHSCCIVRVRCVAAVNIHRWFRAIVYYDLRYVSPSLWPPYNFGIVSYCAIGLRLHSDRVRHSLEPCSWLSRALSPTFGCYAVCNEIISPSSDASMRCKSMD